MSDLWAQFPGDFEMCKRCVGTGRVTCLPCGGCGYTGYVMCTLCGGSGNIQKFGTSATRRRRKAAYDSDEAAAEEKSEEELWAEMSDGRIEILGDISDCERWGLPAELATRWSGRLEQIDPTTPEAEAELNDLAADVRRFDEDCVSAFDLDARGERLASKLSLIDASLELLSKQAAWYQRRFPRGEARPAATSMPEDTERTLREEIEALAAASGPELVVECPGCHTKMKAKNLRLHFDKKHWWKETGTA